MTITPTLRIGTRGSQLALWQANHVADQLRALGHTVSLEVIRTVGDRMQDPAFIPPAAFPDGSPLDAKGIFIKEIEDALASGCIDLAVHSLKDLPTQLDPRFILAAIPPRADARDAFICDDHWGLHMLPSGSRIATTSPRRQAMLLALRPDITFVEMRGNIDTRLRKWSEGHADALVLACAGLDRLNRAESVHQRFAIDELTPAPGQGALALQTRNPSFPHIVPPSVIPPFVIPEGNLRLDGTGTDSNHHAPHHHDQLIHDAISALNCPTSAFATAAERAVLAALGGGCQLPLGAFCHKVTDASTGKDTEVWHLHAMIVSPDGEQVAQVRHRAPIGISAAELGAAVAADLTSRGALDLLSANDSLIPTP